MRLTHIAATVLLASLLGCSANASLVATTGQGASPAPSAPASAAPSPATSPVASATPVPAGSPDATCLAAFDRYNVDKDTFLSADEYVAGRWGDMRFIKAPTAEEEKAAKDGFRADHGKADADKDGKLSRTEFATTCS